MKPLAVPDSPKTLVSATVFTTVATNLTDLKTRARFMVIASTGVRPAELKRAERGDVDLDRRVWAVRTAKGGSPRVFWLNDDMKAAWDAFIAAEAWGHFDGSDYIKERTAHSFLPELEATLKQEAAGRLTVQAMSQRLSDFYMGQWTAAGMPTPYQGPAMTFLVAGFNDNEPYGRTFQVDLPDRPTPVE